MAKDRHKVTVRMDDDVWEGFNDFCTVNGVSVGAMLQATAWRSNERHKAHGGKPVGAYDDPREVEAMSAIVGYARRVDSARRSRVT